MARGLESKAVESQIEVAQAARHSTRTGFDPEKANLESKRNGIQLSRTRVMRDLQTACNARYRAQLETALAYLDKQLAELP